MTLICEIYAFNLLKTVFYFLKFPNLFKIRYSTVVVCIIVNLVETEIG